MVTIQIKQNSFIVFLVIVILSNSFSLAQEFPIGASSPYTYDNYSGQLTDPNDLVFVKECGINLLYTSRENILEAAADYDIDVIFFGTNWSMKNWNSGQYAEYESDEQLEPFYDFTKFSHTNVVGEQEPDIYAENGYTWKVIQGTHSAGWVQRDLIVNYQQDTYWHNIDNSIDYTARFRLKCNVNNIHQQVATLYVVSITNGQETVLNSQDIYLDDFNSINQYQYFDLDFTLYKPTTKSAIPDPPEKITKSAVTTTMDYRIY